MQKQELQHHEELRPSLPSVCQEDKTLLTEAPEGSTLQGAIGSPVTNTVSSSSSSVTHLVSVVTSGSLQDVASRSCDSQAEEL